MFRSKERFNIRGGFINDADEEKVPETVRSIKRGHVRDVRLACLHIKGRTDC